MLVILLECLMLVILECLMLVILLNVSCDTLFLQGKEVETLNPRQKMLINDDDVLNQWFRKGRRGGYRRNCTDANGDNISVE